MQPIKCDKTPIFSYLRPPPSARGRSPWCLCGRGSRGGPARGRGRGKGAETDQAQALGSGIRSERQRALAAGCPASGNMSVSVNTHHNVTLCTHLQHEGDVAEGVSVDGLGPGVGVGGGGPVAGLRVGRGRRELSMRSGHLLLAPSLVVVVCPPDVELRVQVLAVLARQTVTKVRLRHLHHPGPIHVPESPVQARHRDLKLLETEYEPRSDVLLTPVPGI